MLFRSGKVVSSGWSFVSAILGQMTYSIASPTLDSAGSYVMQGAPFTQGTIPSISIGSSISLEGFLHSILLVVNHALLSDPLTSGLCWWLPPKSEASRQLSFPLFATGISLGPLFLLGFVGIFHGSSLCFQSGVKEEDREWICFLVGNSSSGTKKYRGSNSSDGGNTRDGVKIAGGVIGSGEITDGIILEFSKELKEMLPDEAGK
ncbi:hypothetical protein Tco_0862389 [Tanacetum coccineum]